VEPGERMPIRLVQENGETISLDATSVDIVVERQASNFGIPFFDAKKMGIDLNQASVAVEIQGVFADETGQEVTSQSQAIIDFYQPQQLISEKANAGKGGGTSGREQSLYNKKKAAGEQTGIGVKESGKGLGKGGGVGRPGAPLFHPALGSSVLDDWQLKYMDFPVAYWVEQNTALDNPVKTGLELWLKGENYNRPTGWTDSSGFNRNATQSTIGNRPFLRENGVNGNTGVFFNGNKFLEIPFATDLNSGKFTIFVVARATVTGDKPILDSATDGYNLSLNTQTSPLNSQLTAHWVDTGGADSKASPTGTGGIRLNRFDAAVFTYTMEDTDSNGTSDTVNLYSNGRNVATETSGVDYTGASSGVLRIGYDGSNYFNGDIYEVLIYSYTLSDKDRQNVEGYLARKYGLSLAFGHKYAGTGRYSNQIEHVRVAFDNKLRPTLQERHGFLNQRRTTDLRLTAGSPANTSGRVVLDVSGDPRDWFEPAQGRRIRVTFSATNTSPILRKTSGGDNYYGEVVAVSASQITMDLSLGGGTHAQNDYIHIEPIDYGTADFEGTDVAPVIILPIANADTAVKGNISEDAVGPTFPNFADGTLKTAADDGSNLTRTDEYIAFLMSKALTSTYMQLGRDIDASSTTPTMSNVYSVALSESYNGHNARLTITQKYATSLGQKNRIITNLGAGQIPVIQDFSGGKAGKKVKSGGDKAQDLLGILANSNNFLNIQNSRSDKINALLEMTTGFVQQTVYDTPDSQGDFIRGLQIPYNSLATKGKDTLDTEVAQRNFFVTTTNARTTDKISTANTRHASRQFSHTAEGHEKNGISGLVADFNMHRDAEMKAYEFSLVFMAADIIL